MKSLSQMYQEDFKKYINERCEVIKQEFMEREPTETYTDGVYDHRITESIKFDHDQLILDGNTINKIDISVSLKIAVVHPTIVSTFDIESRGRYIQFEEIDVGHMGKLGMGFVTAYVPISEVRERTAKQGPETDA